MENFKIFFNVYTQKKNTPILLTYKQFNEKYNYFIEFKLERKFTSN